MQPYPAMLYLLRPNEMKLEKKGWWWWSGLLNPFSLSHRWALGGDYSKA